MAQIHLTDASIDTIAEAVFAKPNPTVVEAYSEPGQLPKSFRSAPELSSYIRAQLSPPKGLAYVFVVYPDMGGAPVRRKIKLNPAGCQGHTMRYSWDGFGLISIQLQQSDGPISASRVCSNSERRAGAWSSTYPEWQQPGEWNWKAVTSHTRRLQRALRKSRPDAK
jgi:hypothetical protein